MKQHFLLGEAAKILGLKAYQLSYAISIGLIAEPELWIGGKRIFQRSDLQRLAKHFGVECKFDNLTNNKEEKNNGWKTVLESNRVGSVI